MAVTKPKKNTIKWILQLSNKTFVTASVLNSNLILNTNLNKIELKLYLLNSWKICWKLTITESDFSNLADATLLKSPSAVDIFLRTLQQFGNNLLKEQIQKDNFATSRQIKMKGLILIHVSISIYGAKY